MMNYKLWLAIALLCLVGTGCSGDAETDPTPTPSSTRRDSGAAGRADGSVAFPTLDVGPIVLPDAGAVVTTPTPNVDSGTPSVAGEIPCAVEAVLRSKCQTCHSSPTALNAPMPLTTLADFAAPRPSGMTAAEASLARIHATSAPMPPTTNNPLTEGELATLDAWLSGGTPARAAGDVCDSGPVTTTLPCVPTHHFYSHADGDFNRPYDVPTGQNVYVHFWFKSPFTTQNQAIAWAPHIDNTAHVHHYILYRTSGPPAGVADGDVTAGGGGSGAFVVGWAPGKGADVMPSDVGVELAEGTGEWFYLQVHYWNPQGVSGEVDMSGVDMCVIDQPRPKTAGILTMPGFGFPMLPRTAGTWQGTCTPSFVSGHREIFFMGSGPHMHETGTSFSTVIRRASGPEDLVRLETWKFDEQVSYAHDPPVRVTAGESLTTTCNYFNTHPGVTSFGEGTEDEMCFNFALVYPIDALSNRLCAR